MNDDFDDIEKGKASVYEAMEQTYDYARQVSTPAFSLPEFGLQVVLSYIVYGRYYTKVTLSIDLEVGHIWDVKPWQFIFKEMALPDRAPLLSIHDCRGGLVFLPIKFWLNNSKSMGF